MNRIIVIAGAPGSGKSSVAQLLQRKYKSPCFEFGWIPEFRRKGAEEISYEEEEGIAFENLVLVLKNYIKHGFHNIVVTDLEDKRVESFHEHFEKENYALFTLTVNNNDVLKERVMNESRSSDYRDWKSAIKINDKILKRPLLPKEIRINTTTQTLEEVFEEILIHLRKN